MLSGRGKKDYAKEMQTVAEPVPDGQSGDDTANGVGDVPEEALVAL